VTAEAGAGATVATKAGMMGVTLTVTKERKRRKKKKKKKKEEEGLVLVLALEEVGVTRETKRASPKKKLGGNFPYHESVQPFHVHKQGLELELELELE
jgi:hypothetical protein